MPSWSPSAGAATGHVPAWEQAADDDDVNAHIADAVTEIVGEVGYFDPSIVINPDADANEQRTLGDLAHQAAELRAADSWIAGLAPEMDAVIDPMDTRTWIAKGTRAAPVTGKGARGCVDTW